MSVKKICPYYVGTLVGRDHGAVLCCDFPIPEAMLAACEISLHDAVDAADITKALCCGLYEQCKVYHTLQNRIYTKRDDSACSPLNGVLNVLVADTKRARQGK